MLKQGLKTSFPHLASDEVVGKRATWGGEKNSFDVFLSGKLLEADEINSILRSIAARALGRSSIGMADIAAALDRAQRRNRKKESDESKSTKTVWDENDPRLKNLSAFEEYVSKYIIKPGQSPITYDDVVIDPIAKATIRKLLALSRFKAGTGSASLLERLKISGMLFFGPPGTGKTHICRAMANDTEQTLIALSAAELNSKWIGHTEKMIRAMFSLARKLHPCILFLDEADSLFYKRTMFDKVWMRSALNQYLQEMDGLSSNNADDNAPLVVVATNRPEDLDEAFLRRLPHKVYFKLPTCSERKQILQGFLSKDELGLNVNLTDLAKRTKAFSGSDLRALCSQAVLAHATEEAMNGDALETKNVKLTMKHFILAFGRTGPSTSPEMMEKLMEFRQRFQA